MSHGLDGLEVVVVATNVVLEGLGVLVVDVDDGLGNSVEKE